MGFISVRLIALLADVRPYTGWYWLLAVASGIVTAVALPWALIRAARRQAGRPARWPGWLLVGYTVAIAVGMRYYLSLRFTPPGRGIALAPPSARFVLELVGLSAVTLTMTAIALLVLVGMAAVIAPGSVGGRLRALRERRASATRLPGPLDDRLLAVPQHAVVGLASNSRAQATSEGALGLRPSVGDAHGRRQRPRIPGGPGASLGRAHKRADQVIEQLGLLQVECMPGVRDDREPGCRDGALEQQAWFQAGLVLVAVDHEHGRGDAGQLTGDVVQGRPGPLDPGDGEGHAFGGMPGQLPGELFPDGAVLAP
jgi:hypothetical protein